MTQTQSPDHQPRERAVPCTYAAIDPHTGRPTHTTSNVGAVCDQHVAVTQTQSGINDR